MLPRNITKRVNLKVLKNPNIANLVDVVDQLTPNYEVDEAFVELCPNVGGDVLVVTFYRENHWPVK